MSVTQKTYEELKNHIISLSYAPGENLDELSLRNELKVSRTPIRIALCKLEQEGFVVHRPGRGYYVKEIRLHQVKSLFLVREYLEIPAVKLAINNATDDDLAQFQNFVQKMQTTLDNGDYEKHISEGVEFHFRMCQMSGNEILAEMVKNLNERLSIVARILLRANECMESSHLEHKEILTSLLKRDVNEAEKLVKQHICESSKRFVSLLQSKLDLLSIVPLNVS